MKLICIMFAFCLFGGARLQSQGYIVPNGIGSSSSGSRFSMGVIQNPSNGDYTCFDLVRQGANGFLFNPCLDEGVRTFLVLPNVPISLQPIIANNYPELTFPDSYVFADRTPFYLGFYTGYHPWLGDGTYTGIYTDPLFGWAKLVNVNGVIQMLDSALEYGGGGIYVGTQTIIPVPEPSFLALAAIGTLALWCQHRRQFP